MIKKLFNKINNLRFPNETGDNVSNIIDFIAKNKLSFFQVQNDYNQENRETFKYNRVLKKINIPNDFSQEPGNKEIYEEAKIQYGNSALETIVSHEIGHQIHHQFLRKQENLNNWDIGKYGDICLTHTGIADNPNHKLNEANDFFKVDHSVSSWQANPQSNQKTHQQKSLDFSRLFLLLYNLNPML